MIKPNKFILDSYITRIRKNLNNCFDKIPHIYTALALNDMDFSDDAILEFLKDEADSYNEYSEKLAKEMKDRENGEVSEEESDKFVDF